MKFIPAAAALAAALTLTPALAADDGPWLVRVRALHLDSANKDTTGLGLSINDKAIPEVDISYFLTPHVAAELILTYPQKHKLSSNGAEIGSLKHLPPTLTLQYHYNPAGTVRPYVGAGLNFTHFSSVKFAPAVQSALQPSIKNNSWGAAAQVGVDIEVAKGLFLNFDVKKVKLGTTVYSKGVKAGEFKVDPTLVSAGIGWRF